MTTAICLYTAHCFVKRLVGGADKWGEAMPVRLEGGSICWNLSQAMDGSFSTYKRTLNEPVQPKLDDASIFEPTWAGRRLRGMTITTSVFADTEKFQSGQFDNEDIENLNQQAKQGLVGKYPTPGDVQQPA